MPADEGHYMLNHKVYCGTAVPEWAKWLFWTVIVIAIMMW